MLKGKKWESNLTNKYMSFTSPANLKQYHLGPGLPTEGPCRLSSRCVSISVLHHGTLWPLGSMETNSADATSRICNTSFFHSWGLD